MKEAATALRVADPDIRALFAQDSRWQAWMDVEGALARAEMADRQARVARRVAGELSAFVAAGIR